MSDDFQGDAPSDANQTATVTPPPQPTPAPQPDPGPKPFDPAAFFDDQHAQIAGARKALLASSMAGAVETEPERQSKIIAIADKLGVPSQAVASNYDAFARQIALTDSDYARTLVHHPDVASWLQIPDNAKLAHDDVPQLGELDRSFKKLAGQDVTGFLPEGYRFLPDGTIRGPLHVDGTPPAIYKSLSALRDRLQIEEGQEAVAEAPIKAAQERLNQGNFPSLESGLESAVASTLRFFAIGSGGVEPVTGITADQAKQMATVASIASERINPGLSGTAARAIGSLIGDAPFYLLGGEFAAASDMAKSLSIVRRAAQTLPEVPASAYLADVWKTALAYSPIGVRSGVNTGSDNGVAYGSLDFLINTLGPASIGSKIGLANAIIPGAETAAAAGGWGGFATRLVKHIGAQGGVMTATELANALHEYASGVNPDALKPENLVPRLAQAGAMGAAMVGAFHIPGALSEQIGRQQVAARAAMIHADNLGAAIEAAKATKADRSPERYGDLMRQSMPEEARTVYYQGDDFEEVAKAAQMTPADLASKLGVENEYKLALATGKTMSVPTDKLVEFARGLEDDTAIQAIIRRQRQDPNGTNAEEALEFYKDAPDEIAKQAESFQVEVKKAAGSVSESDPIFNDFMAQAADSGRPLDEARQDARLMAAFYNVGAERFNAGKADGEPRMDPWEEYQKARLRVTGERAPEVEPLDAMLRRLRKGDIPKEESATPLSDYLRKQGFPEDINEENADEAAEQAHTKGFIAENTREALIAELEAEQGRPPARDSQIRAALLDLKDTLERHGIDLGKSDADIKAALGKGEGEAVKRFEQRLEVPSDYLKHEYLLKQWKKAHGDRSPTPTDKDWQKLVAQADMVDEAQGRRFFQPGDKGPRGSLSFNAERHFVMTLTGRANLSTVLHESGHFWLEQMGEWAERADAPEQLKADYVKILGFLGVEKRADIETEHHEKFARAIEQYLMEGRSPSPELRGAFARFAIWLTALYKQAKSLVNLTPEVRDVFDRLFATDRAIEEARKDLGTSTIFKDQATSGMNDVQWKAYLNAIQRDRESQFANVYSKAMATLRRENTRTYKRELAQATADATKIIDDRPVTKAMRTMVDGLDSEGKPLANPPKLDRADVEREFGKGNVHMLPRGITVDEGGWTLDRAAAEFGFRSGADLWTALAQKPDRAKDIKALADAIIKGRHPEMTADGMHDAAMDAVHANSAHADVLSRESAALAIKAQRRPIPQAHLFRMAEGIIARQNHRDVKSSAYIRAEKKANDESSDALLKPDPDYTAAFLAKQRAELAHACYRAAMEAEAIIEKTHALMKDVKREKTLGMLGKAGGFVVSSPESSAAYPSEQEAQAAIDEMTERGVQGVTLATYQQRMNQLRAFWEDPDHRNDMDYGAVHDFYTEARSILHQARDAFTVMQEGEKAKLAEVISKGIQTQQATTGGKRVVVPRSKTKLYYIQKGLRDFDAFNRTLAAVARQMDGDKPNGWHFNTLVRPLNDAQNREVELRREYGQKMRDLMDAYGKRGELSKRLFIPAINDHLSLESRLAIMLNSGSTRNLDRLMNGPDQYTREQINAINHTLDEKDIALVKGIWALHNSFWPHIAAMEMKIHGIEPEKRDAIPVSTKFGTIDGAYYPIMYDADTSARAFQFSLEKAPNPLMGSPSKGFTKKTMETTGMRLRHDLMAAFQHNDQVAHYLAHAETIHNLNKILNNPDLKASIIDHFGIETYRLISERVKTVAEGARGPQSPIEKGLAFIRKRTGLAAVAFNVSTFVAHGFGIPQSMYRVGAGRYLSAMLRMTASAGQADSFFKMAAEKSSLMRNLHSALTPERYETMDNGSGGRIHQWFLDHAHDLIHLALKPINTATWVAEYERHIDEGKPEADAVALADQAVRDTQGTGQTIDMTKAQDLNELSRLMMQFSIFFTRTYQLGRQPVVDAFVKRDPASIMALLKATTMLVTIPTLTQALFHQAVKPDPSDDNSPGWWLSKLGRDHLEYLLSTFIGGRELSSLVEGYDYQGPAGMRSFSTVGTLVKELKGLWGDHPNLPGLGRTGLNLGLSLAGLPANQLDKILRGFIYDQDEGSASPLPLLFGPPPAHR